ncbi:MAG: hypothetical protein FVQ83_08800 [Chloroflexi bacterium]|nr:hypothetical protein [Chloroflexota bacterium]
MLLILPILILLLTPLTMLVLRRLRPEFDAHWLLAAGGTFLAWATLFVLRARLPQTVSLPLWRPKEFFPVSPELLADSFSWPFALALATLVLSVILTDAARLSEADWSSWAGSLSLAAVGILAVFSGNLLTLVMAWVVIDILELVILLPRIKDNVSRQGVIIYFSTSLLGTMLVVLAGILSHESGVDNLAFSIIPPRIGVYLLIAVGLRLGVLPLHIYYLHEPPLRRGLGSILRFVPAAASLVLLARIGNAGIPLEFSPYILWLTLLAAIYGAVMWLRVDDEIIGMPYWILALTALALASAVVAQPEAALSWSLAILYSGALLFLASSRGARQAPLILLGLVGISALPFSPTQASAGLYSGSFGLSLGGFLVVQGLLLLGYLRHALRPVGSLAGAERWVWAIYILGLGLLPVIHLLAGGLLAPEDILAQETLMWWPGLAALGIASVFGALSRQSLDGSQRFFTIFENVFSLDWFYRVLLRGTRTVDRIMSFLAALLEGEAGVLWAVLLVALLFSLLAQINLGT